MVPDLGSSRGESTTSKIGFCPGNVQERLWNGWTRWIMWQLGSELIWNLMHTWPRNALFHHYYYLSVYSCTQAFKWDPYTVWIINQTVRLWRTWKVEKKRLFLCRNQSNKTATESSISAVDGDESQNAVRCGVGITVDWVVPDWKVEVGIVWVMHCQAAVLELLLYADLTTHTDDVQTFFITLLQTLYVCVTVQTNMREFNAPVVQTWSDRYC